MFAPKRANAKFVKGVPRPDCTMLLTGGSSNDGDGQDSHVRLLRTFEGSINCIFASLV